jgi:hypothetical protein
MIDELYDSVLSVTNQTGYIDRISELNKNSLLRFSSNNLFNYNNYKIYTPKYTVKVFSHDNHFKTPFACLIKDNGVIDNID